MKFWQLNSVLGTETSLINQVAATRPDLAFVQDWMRDFSLIVEAQDREKLDAEIPVDFVRSVLSLSVRTLFIHEDEWLRSRPLSPIDKAISALSAFDRFGGTAIEDALEYGSVNVRSS